VFDFLLRPFRRRFGKDREYYRIIDDLFGFVPHNIEIYKLALIHKSASLVLDNGRQINNERLEFLGDAVIEAVTSDYLYIEFPDRDEGFMTQLRSKIVSRQSLNQIARNIGLDRHIIIQMNGNVVQKHIFGDAFEAMIGAIYLDQGYEFVNRLLINRLYYEHLDLDDLTAYETDFKSRLIEWCQKNHHSIQFASSKGKNYASNHPVFQSTVLIDGMEVGHGTGDSKKEAEQRAAFSVSQGVTDKACESLLDRIDDMETRTADKSASSEPSTPDSTEIPETDRPKRRRKRTQAPKPAQPEDNDDSNAPRSPAPENTTKAADPNAAEKTISETPAESKPEERNAAETTETNVGEAAGAKRRRKRAQASAAGDAAEQSAEKGNAPASSPSKRSRPPRIAAAEAEIDPNGAQSEYSAPSIRETETVQNTAKATETPPRIRPASTDENVA